MSTRLFLVFAAVGGLLLLAGCASMPEWFTTPQGQEVMEKGVNAAGKLLSGDMAGAIGQSIDLVLILLGLKGAQVGTQKLSQVVKHES